MRISADSALDVSTCTVRPSLRRMLVVVRRCTCSVLRTVAQPQPSAKPKPRPPPHYPWAALLARVYEVFPLICPMCGGQMRIIAFITFSADIHMILEHIGVEPEGPAHHPGARAAVVG